MMAAVTRNILLSCVFLYGGVQGESALCDPKCSVKPQGRGIAVTCNGLRSVPSKWPNLTISIALHNLHTDEIPSNSFSDLDLLNKVEIVNSSIAYIRKFAFHGFRDFKNIHLYGTRVNKIESYAFSKIDTLVCLRIHNSSVGEITSNAFNQISGVNEIGFHNTTIRYIKAGAFTNVRRVAIWLLTNNYIGTIETGAFSKSSLAFLELHGNTFENIMTGSLDVAIETAMNQASIGENQMCCGCQVLWMLQPGTRRKLDGFLKTLKCLNSRNTVDNISMQYLSNISWEDVPCENEAESTSPCSGIQVVQIVPVSANLRSGTSKSNSWHAPVVFVLTSLNLLSVILM